MSEPDGPSVTKVLVFWGLPETSVLVTRPMSAPDIACVTNAEDVCQSPEISSRAPDE